MRPRPAGLIEQTFEVVIAERVQIPAVDRGDLELLVGRDQPDPLTHPAHLRIVLLDAVSTNNLKLKMEVIDEGALIEGFQKIANRITLGLLLASLIVGAALLMQVRTTFTIWGYPGLAMIFFLLAAAGGSWLAISILTGDRPARHKPPPG